LRPPKSEGPDFLTYSAEHRRIIINAISAGPYLDAVKGMALADMHAMAEREFVRLGVDAKVLSVERLPFGGVYRLNFRIIFASTAEYVDFDPDK